MYWQLASAVDAVHAVFMIAQVGGLPLLFVHRWPRLTRAYGVYAIVFIVLSQASQYFLGECFLTTIARALWKLGAVPGSVASPEWFTVRFAEAVFHMTPSHKAITIIGEALILVTAIGILHTVRRGSAHKDSSPSRTAPSSP
jgi:hypothetical protein